jgi:hypothetical protein
VTEKRNRESTTEKRHRARIFKVGGTSFMRSIQFMFEKAWQVVRQLEIPYERLAIGTYPTK